MIHLADDRHIYETSGRARAQLINAFYGCALYASGPESEIRNPIAGRPHPAGRHPLPTEAI